MKLDRPFCYRLFIYLGIVALLGSSLVSGQAISPNALRQIEELSAEKESRTPAQRKIDSRLHYGAMTARGQRLTSSVEALPSLMNSLERDNAGNVLVDIKANVTAPVLAAIRGAGGTVVSALPQYRAIRASVPLLGLESLAGLADVEFIRPADRGTHGGMPGKTAAARTLPLHRLGASLFLRPLSQGDVAHGANLVRSNYGLDGTGVKVGVLSDGVDALATLQASGDLPNVNIIPGQAGSGNEGAAMLEIVYDLAPGAQLYFATAHSGVAQMAANIIALQQAGCEIILDDWTYFAEPVFQDGPIANAVNTVTAQGVLYFSDAQNSGNLDSNRSGTWEGDFADSGTTLPGVPGGLSIHSFGAANHDLITASTTEGYLSVKWSDPLGGSSNDYDFYLLNNALTAVLAASTNIQSGTQDPIETITCAAPCALNDQIVIVKKASALTRALHVDTERGRLQIGTDGATFGHNGGRNSVTVAAVNVAKATGGLFTGGAADPVETYSSDGLRRIFYQPNGTPITPGNLLFATNGGTVLQKDDIAAADCASGHAPGYTVFCGTSAATPHAGAIAALIKSGYPALSAQQILDTMKGTALDIMTPGVDRDSGSGIVMANLAVDALSKDPAVQTTLQSVTVLSPTQIALTIAVTNGTAGMAFNASLNSLVFRTLSGAGSVNSASALPIVIGSLAPNQQVTIGLTLNVPASVIRFSVGSAFTLRNASGAAFTASASNVVVR